MEHCSDYFHCGLDGGKVSAVTPDEVCDFCQSQDLKGVESVNGAMFCLLSIVGWTADNCRLWLWIKSVTLKELEV